MTSLQTVRREIDFALRIHKADADAHHDATEGGDTDTKECHIDFVALMTEDAFT